MRPIFTIYVVTGLILLVAVAYAAAHGYHAYATRIAIAALAPGGRDLERMRNVVDADIGVVVWSSVLGIAQIIVFIAARKLKGRANAA